MKAYIKNTLSTFKKGLAWFGKNFFSELKDELIRFYFNNKTGLLSFLGLLIFTIVFFVIPEFVAFVLFLLGATLLLAISVFVLFDMINLEKFNYPILQTFAAIFIVIICLICYVFGICCIVKSLWY